jgi:Ca-activated chloride channel family protein
MKNNAYKEAMDKIPVSGDFEERTLARLREERAKKRRVANRVRVLAAGLAAALALALGVPTLINRSDNAVPEGPMNEAVSEALVNTKTQRTSEPLPDYAFSADLAPAAMPEYNTEEYAYIRENGFESVLTNPLSTFAADVDTASYANIRRLLLDGETVPADAVRIEEMINYFDYDYPEPEDGAPFSVTTRIADCPWNADAKLLLVGLQAKEIDESERPNSNLVFLIDVSGSMDSSDKLGLAQQAFLLLADELREGDTVSIVTYAGTDSVVLEGAGIEDKAEIMSSIEGLFAGGSTAGAAGIETAYEIAEKYFIDGGNNRVILATDGDLNVGVTSEGALTRLIEEKRKTGVSLSVMGFGTENLKDNKLEALADNGNGNYSYIDSLLEAKKVLVEELGATFFTVAKDVKLQIEFNPAKVASYRQIGYENRALADEDFADDTVDGGEIGAGHRVTVLYEIIEATGDEESSLKYQTNQATGSDEYLTVSVRAKAPDGDESKLYEYPVGGESVFAEMPDDMKFAAAISEVGMLLRGSQYAGTSSYENALALLESIPGIHDDPYKDEFLYLVRRLARSNGS